MSKYLEIKAEKQKKYDQLITNCKVFFAFSDEQFIKNKTELKECEKYVSIGAGGYMPKGYLKIWIDGSKEIEKWAKDEIKKYKIEEHHILFELRNNECFYTGSYQDALPFLPYSEEQVSKVFYNNLKDFS